MTRSLTPLILALCAGPLLLPAEAIGQSRKCCVIKGNINTRRDRICHLPGDHYYDRTRISTAHGERWFCSEQEARAAGWRRTRK